VILSECYGTGTMTLGTGSGRMCPPLGKRDILWVFGGWEWGKSPLGKRDTRVFFGGDSVYRKPIKIL